MKKNPHALQRMRDFLMRAWRERRRTFNLYETSDSHSRALEWLHTISPSVGFDKETE
jgi:hypothetical protein